MPPISLMLSFTLEFTSILERFLYMFGFVITSCFFIIRKAVLNAQFIASMNQFIAVFVTVANANFIRYL